MIAVLLKNVGNQIGNEIIFDHRKMFRSFKKLYLKDIKLGNIKSIYRNLRDNYEYNLRYDTAGEFFIREKEVDRLFSEKQKIQRGY